MHSLIALFTSLVTIVIMDFLWLSLMMPIIYKKYLGHLLASTPNFFAAGMFYLVYAFGVYYLVVRLSLLHNLSLLSTFFTGAILGIVAYGTYDLTNQATLPKWPTFITVIDMVWGGILTGTVALVSLWITRKFAS